MAAISETTTGSLFKLPANLREQQWQLLLIERQLWAIEAWAVSQKATTRKGMKLHMTSGVATALELS